MFNANMNGFGMFNNTEGMTPFPSWMKDQEHGDLNRSREARFDDVLENGPQDHVVMAAIADDIFRHQVKQAAKIDQVGGGRKNFGVGIIPPEITSSGDDDGGGGSGPLPKKQTDLTINTDLPQDTVPVAKICAPRMVASKMWW